MNSQSRLPVIFFGHGNPMNALADNACTRAWTAIGAALPKPRAVLCVSAHWYKPGCAATGAAKPRTIHDFGGFPRELFEVQYPAPGSPALVREVQELLQPTPVGIDHDWGLDRGAWSVMRNVFPDADTPIVQLAIDETLPAQAHYELGRRLAPLRDRGVLIVGSGNLVHNLHAYAWGRQAIEPYDWAVRFETQARAWLQSGEHQPLIDYERLGRDAALSAPTPDHYLPLLYVLGAQLPGDEVAYPVEGMDGGSVSMLTVWIGPAEPE